MTTADELKPAATPFELGIELAHASHKLMSLATEHVIAGRHAVAHAIISDSITLDKLGARLDAGTLSVELAQLFVEAASTLVERRDAELEATS